MENEGTQIQDLSNKENLVEQTTETPNSDNIQEITSQESTVVNEEESTTVEISTAKQAPKQDTIKQRKEIIKELEDIYNQGNTDISETIANFRKLQGEWKALGNETPTEDTQNIWKEYNSFQDKFYELSKINRELIEYNYKKNLELKMQVCQNAAKLLEQEDITKAFRSLQILHKEWKEIGHISKELSEEVWEKFKNTSDEINNKYTEFLNANKEKNEEISNKKNIWCEEIENIDISSLITHKDWETMAERIKEINKLFIIDNVSGNKLNQQLYKRLRSACDKFFELKSKFYASKKDMMQENLEKKIALLAKAEELKNSTDWKNTTNKIIELQKEWKEIGPTNHKNSKSTWEQFIAACDYFFDQKNKLFSSKKDEEKENLQLKKDLIEKVERYTLTEIENENLDNLKIFYKEFNEIGHVSFKEKDKIYVQFKDAIDKQYDNIKIKFHISSKNYGNNRQTLQKKYEQLKAEIATCENNIGFFSSNKTSSIVKDLQRKINNLKVELTVILDQLNKFEN